MNTDGHGYIRNAELRIQYLCLSVSICGSIFELLRRLPRLWQSGHLPRRGDVAERQPLPEGIEWRGKRSDAVGIAHFSGKGGIGKIPVAANRARVLTE